MWDKATAKEMAVADLGRMVLVRAGHDVPRDDDDAFYICSYRNKK
jgi:hypothetical protein